MAHARPLAGFLLALILSSCVAYRPRPIEPARAAAAFEARALSEPKLRTFIESSLGRPLEAWPPSAWTLDELALSAIYFQPDLDIARAHFAVMTAGKKTAAQLPNPALTMTFERVTHTASPPWIYGAGLDLTIETAGKRGARRLKAAALAEQARLELAQSAWTTRSRVRAAAVELWAARAAEHVLRHQQSELAGNEDLLAARARRGETSPLNSAQAVLLSDRSRLALADAAKRRVAAAAALADALGVPLRAVDEVSISTAAFEAPLPDDAAVEKARASALETRPDLLAALAAYAAAEADVRLEVAKQYPDVHLAPGATYDQGADKWGIGFNLPIPLLNRNQGPIAEAEARRRESEARFLALQARVLNDIAKARAALRAAGDKLKAADAALARHREQDAVFRRLLRPGDVSRLTLFRSQLDLDTTRLSRAQAAAEGEQALGLLEDALERPLIGVAAPPAAYERDIR